MLSQNEIMQTIQMIDQQHLDVRTITMGISLLSCAHSDTKVACQKIYDKITRNADIPVFVCLDYSSHGYVSISSDK